MKKRYVVKTKIKTLNKGDHCVVLQTNLSAEDLEKVLTPFHLFDKIVGTAEDIDYGLESVIDRIFTVSIETEPE